MQASYKISQLNWSKIPMEKPEPVITPHRSKLTILGWK